MKTEPVVEADSVVIYDAFLMGAIFIEIAYCNAGAVAFSIMGLRTSLRSGTPISSRS